MATQVKCKLFAGLRAKVGSKEVVLSFESTPRVQEVLQRLGLDGGDRYILLRNGVHVDPKDTVGDGDALSIFPMIAGG